MSIDLCCKEHHINEQLIETTKNNFPQDEEVLIISDIFKALSDSSRLKIILTLLNQELCVCDIVDIVNMSQSAVSHQLRTLRNAKLVKFRREGKMIFYSIDDHHVENLIKQTLEHIREERL